MIMKGVADKDPRYSDYCDYTRESVRLDKLERNIQALKNTPGVDNQIIADLEDTLNAGRVNQIARAEAAEDWHDEMEINSGNQ
jgi:hypothetical protein